MITEFVFDSKVTRIRNNKTIKTRVDRYGELVLLDQKDSKAELENGAVYRKGNHFAVIYLNNFIDFLIVAIMECINHECVHYLLNKLRIKSKTEEIIVSRLHHPEITINKVMRRLKELSK